MAIYNGHNEDASGNILLSIGNGMTATVETGTKTTQAYTKGALLFFNNKLCKTTTAIATNTTITIGTNVAQTSIGTELTSHLVSSDGKEFYFDVKDGKYGYYPSSSKTASEFVPFGGTLSETVLWTNSSPTSNFAAQDITVSSMSSFSYIKVNWGTSTTNYTSDPDIGILIVPLDNFIATKDTSASVRGASYRLGGESTATGVGGWYRRFKYNSNTVIHFNYCYDMAGNTTNDHLIPLNIYGLK